MKRFLTAILACITLFVTLGASAEAAPIRNCGSIGPAYNVTARKFTCREARGITREYIANGKAHMLYETVRYDRPPGYADVRLHDGGWVVRFQMAQD